MFSITERLGTLDPKAKAATRTAKDGEEYSQLVYEVEHEVDEPETNSLCGSPQAYQAYKAVFRAVKGTTFIDFEERLEAATVILRLAAVSPQNGPEFTFNDCRVDKFSFSNMDGEVLKVRYRVTAKPALDGKFGELIARMGHTVTVRVSGSSSADQKELPLSGHGEHEAGTSSIGSPDQEREKARKKQRQIERDMEAGHLGVH